MATHIEVIRYLRPDGGYVAYGDDFEGIEFLDAEPFTKKEYEAAFAVVDKVKADEAERLAAKKAAAEAKLAVLGLDLDDLRVLGLA